MPTSYTSLLKLALPVAGELSGSWGDVVNANITSMIEEAIAGKASISTWTTQSHTLTTANGTTSEARAAILDCTGSPGGAATVICPTSSKVYILRNGTTGGFAVTLKTAAGTGISVANGKTALLYCDGTNVVEGINYVATAGALSSTLSVSGGGTGATTLTGLVKGNGTSAMTAAVAGTDYLAPAAIGSTVQAYNANLTTWAGKTAPTGTVLGTTDTQTLTNKTLTGYTETVYALSGTDINPANGTIQTKTLSANTTFTESIAEGQSVTLMLNPSTFTVTWPTASWISTAGTNTAPTLKASVLNCIVLWRSGGVLNGNWKGSL